MNNYQFLSVEQHQCCIVLSVDYEIFGNGTGDVKQHIIKPMEMMAQLGLTCNCFFTVFVEVEEYINFCKYSDQLQTMYSYNPADLIRQQIKSLVKQGHDIQLHIHPQWYNALFEGGKWKLNHQFASVDDLFVSQKEVTQYIKTRKNVLEEIIHEVDPSRKIIAYRAGSFCAQPGKKLIKALADNNIRIDSSVVKGMAHESNFSAIDYRSTANNGPFWRISNDVSIDDPNGLLYEFPIFSIMKRRWNQISIKRLKAKFSRNVPQQRQLEMLTELGISGNPIKLIKFLFQPVPIKLDMHNCSAMQLLSMIRQSRSNRKDRATSIAVMIGHTKEHIDNQSLEAFFTENSKHTSFHVVTFSQIAKQFLPTLA
jgi:hypothetical protein